MSLLRLLQLLRAESEPLVLDNSSGITMRYARIEDAAGFSGAFRAVLEPLDLYNAWAKRVEFEKYSQANVPALLAADSHSILLAFEGSEIAGFFVTRPDDGPLWLSWFGVLPKYRGLKLTDRLFARGIAEARERGIGKIWCDCRVNNVYAMAIFERHGFTRLARLDQHWFGLDFYIWEKMLDAHPRS